MPMFVEMVCLVVGQTDSLPSSCRAS